MGYLLIRDFSARITHSLTNQREHLSVAAQCDPTVVYATKLWHQNCVEAVYPISCSKAYYAPVESPLRSVASTGLSREAWSNAWADTNTAEGRVRCRGYCTREGNSS